MVFPAPYARCREFPRAPLRDRRGLRRRRRRADGRRHARDPHADAETTGAGQAGRRRSSSTSACAPTRRRSRSGARRTSTTQASCAQAAPIFARYGSLEAQVGTALAYWPRGFGTLTELAADAPAQLARPAALRARPLLARRPAGGEGGVAEGAHGAARHLVRAARGRPALPAVPARPADVRAELPPAGGARQALAAAAARLPERARGRSGGSCSRRRLLQRLGRQLSAVREFDAASQLGAGRRRGAGAARSGASTRPIRRGRSRGSARSRSAFRRSQSVRFHLGLLPALARQRERGAEGTAARTRPRTRGRRSACRRAGSSSGSLKSGLG